MIAKLIDIMKRQELDTYNPYLQLPKPQQIYLKRLENLMRSEVVRIKCKQCYSIFEWTLNDTSLIDNPVNIILCDLDEPMNSSEIGSLELTKNTSSWAREKALETQEKIEFELMKQQK